MRRDVRTIFARECNPSLSERRELHAEQAFLLPLVTLLALGSHRQKESGPGFQASCQRRDDHVGPVAQEIVERGRRCMHATLQLLNDGVFLITPIVGLEHDLFRRAFRIVGNVEEAPCVIEQLAVPLQDLQILSKHDHTVRRLTGDRSIPKLRDMLIGQRDVLKLATLDHCLFDVLLPTTRRGFDFLPFPTVESSPGLVRQFLHDLV